MNKKILAVISLGLLTLTACNKPDTATTSNAGDANAVSDATQSKKIRIATESSYKPFSYLNANGGHEGFEIDLIHALCADMKADCTISSHDWDGIIPGLMANKYDAIFASMSATDERRKVIQFSEPYFNNQLVLVGQKSDATTMQNIGGKTVAAQQATVAAKYLENNHPDVEIKIYDKQNNAYLDMSAGRVSYLLSDIGPALEWLKTPEAVNFEIKGTGIDINDNIAIALRQDDTQLTNDFNTALANLKQSGEYDAIVGKYFDLNAVNSVSQQASNAMPQAVEATTTN